MNWNRQRVLVAGGAGMIGSHLSRELLRRGAAVTIADNLSSGSLRNVEDIAKDAEVITADLREKQNCLRVTRNKDVVVQLAANMGGMLVISTVHADIMRDSGLINIQMLDAARKNGAPRYFFSSSACALNIDKQTDPNNPGLKEEDAFPGNPNECMPPDVSLPCNYARTSIANVNIGDLVLDHSGNWSKVTNTMSRGYDGELYSIKHRMGCDFPKLTPNHPMLICRRVSDRPVVFDPPKWILAKDVRKGDRVVIPIPREAEDNGVEEGFLHIAGLYVAEGSIDHKFYFDKEYNKRYSNGWRIALWYGAKNIDEMRYVERYLAAKGVGYTEFKHAQSKDLYGLEIRSPEMVEKLKEFGIHAENKCIPEWVMKLPASRQKTFLDCYLMGDGWDITVHGNRTIGAGTKSETLAYQLFQLFMRQGWYPRIQKMQTKPFNGRTRPSHLPTFVPGTFYHVLSTEYRNKGNSNWAASRDENNIYATVTAVHKTPYTGTVHNIEVENTHTYTVEAGAAVHNCYGWEKLFSEVMCSSFALDYGMNIRIARFHNVFGPAFTAFDKFKAKAPCRMIIDCIRRDTVEVWNDGRQTRSFLYIDDCVDGVLKLLESDYRSPINIGSDRLVSMTEFAELVIHISGKDIRPTYFPDKPMGVRGRCSDNTLVKRVLGWEPKAPLEQGMKTTYAWALENLSRLEGLE